MQKVSIILFQTMQKFDDIVNFSTLSLRKKQIYIDGVKNWNVSRKIT